VAWWSLEWPEFDFDLRYRRALLERGTDNFPVAVKQGSISFAHMPQDIDQTLNAIADTARELR
jgi:glutamate-1-semialdehyde 2,1-aminomutase